jgi:RNA polymerase sigma-70 factor (ECF subfamily)
VGTARAKEWTGMPAEVAGGDTLSGLMTAYQSGDGGAFEALYGALAPQVGGYLRALCRDATRAEDLLQETFLQVHRSRHTYLPSRPVKPWIYAIARHVFLMSCRSTSRRRRHETTADDELPEIPIPPEVARLADRDTLQRALGSIPADRREALLLRHVWGLSFREVGAVQGVTEAAAKLRAHRGVVGLRALLGSTQGGS